MSNLASKVCRRILAVVLSIAMVMPNMAVTAYAAEASAAQKDEVSVQGNDTDVQADGDESSGGDTSEDGDTPSGGDTSEGGDTPEGENPPSGDGENDTDGSGKLKDGRYNFIVDFADMEVGNKEIGASERAGKTKVDGESVDVPYFTLIYNAASASKVEARAKSSFTATGVDKEGTAVEAPAKVPDYASTNALNMQGTVAQDEETSAISKAIRFTAGQNETAVKVWWEYGGSSAPRNIGIYKDNIFKESAEGADAKPDNALQKSTTSANGVYYTEFVLNEAADYYLGGTTDSTGGIRIYKVEVDTEFEAARSAYAAPTIKDVKLNEAGDSIDVTVEANTSYATGGDELTVTMYDADGNVAGEPQTTRYLKDEYVISFKPEAAGTYTFKAVLIRDGEEDGKESAASEAIDFVLPFSAPANLKVLNKSEDDKAIVEVSWDAVTGADKYSLTVTEKGAAESAAPVYEKKDVTETTVTVSEGIERGKTYLFTVVGIANAAAGGEEKETDPSTEEFTIPAAPNSSVTKTTYKFDATALTAAEDKEEIPAGTTLGDEGYFKVVKLQVEGDADGKVIKRISSTTKAVTGIEIGKWSSAAIEFTITGTADVVFEAASTGSSNTSTIALVNGNGEVQKNDEGKDIVSGSSQYTTLTYRDLPAGTYHILSPKHDDYNRGARVKTITVDEYTSGGAMTETEYLYDATTLTAKEDKEEIPSGTTLFDFFKVMTYTVQAPGSDGKPADHTGKVTKRYSSDKNAVTSTEVDKYLSSAIQFEITGTADVEIEMSSTGGSNESVAGLVDASDKVIPNNEGITTVTGTSRTKMTYSDLGAGTYRVASPGTLGDNLNRGARLYTIKVKEITGGSRPPRADWSAVAAPEITSIALDADKNKVNVAVSALIDYDGGDQVTVSMKNAEGVEVDAQSSGNSGSSHTLTFTPEASGTYTFTVKLTRRNEEDKAGAEAKEFKFTLPLTKPNLKGATSKGAVAGSDPKSGSVELQWDEVKEATEYIISVKEKDSEAEAKTIPVPGDKFEYLLQEGLTIGKTYIFTVTAKRAGTGENGADELTPPSDGQSVEITEDSQITWMFSVYGDSTNKTSNGYISYEGKKYPESTEKTLGETIGGVNKAGDLVRVWSQGNAGKIVPASVDGLAFYYTEINPNTTNFKLSATAHVNEWTLSNAQDGFGMMAADRVGKHEDAGKWWNNSYQALASKVEYRWNPDKAIPDYSGNTDYPRYSMKLGIGSTEKLGVTVENLPELNNTKTVVDATKKYFKSNTKTLDTSTVNLPGGTYNIIGNYSGGTPDGTQKALLVTDLRFTIELNATGYYLSYTPIDKDGKLLEDKTITNKHYDRDALSHIEKDSVYIGFFASRNADITFKDVNFETRDYDSSEEKEKKPVEYIVPAYSITSASTSNTVEYDMLFSANWPGKLTITNAKGEVLVEPGKDENGKELNNVVADQYGNIEVFKVDKSVTLGIGVNEFQWQFEPDKGYSLVLDPNPNYGQDPSEPPAFTELSDYTTQIGTFTVTYKTYGATGQALYVSPKGSALGTGTKANPLDIYTAVKYVQPGQTIYLMGGTYNLSKTVTIGKGISGTVDVEYKTDENGNFTRDGYGFKEINGSPKVTQYIYMLPDPESENAGIRPVLDFGRTCEGLVVAGDAWYLKGFDVTRSQLSKDGMRVCGSFNVVEQVNTYKNGNTGIQISRFGSDSKDYWPQYNLILNCTSYLNADQGFEDADGFAAKLTIGQGNVFDGCIAAYNADDGWDLFAKVESGNIGKVTIQNSIAYRNGYVRVVDSNGDGKITNDEARDANRELSLEKGLIYPAGNGNGFKMGGSNLPGGHRLYNSVAFYNAAKGIDSNSCPDIKAYNSISFNNEGYNVAFYGTTSDSDFAADNLISYRTDEPYDVWVKEMVDGFETGTLVVDTEASKTSSYLTAVKRDNLASSGKQSLALDEEGNPKGTPSEILKFINDSSYYYREDGAKNSTNASGASVAADWFVKADNASFKEFDEAFRADINYARGAGNRIDLHGFLTLTDKAGTASGGSVGGAGSEAYPVPLPELPSDVPATDGEVSGGNAGNETESGVRPEDMARYSAYLAEAGSSTAILGLWFNIVDSEDVYYTGKPVKPEVHVYENTTLLTKKDYTITYKNNTNAYVAKYDSGHPTNNTCADAANHKYTDTDGTEKELAGLYSNVEDKKKPTIIVRGKGNYIGMAGEQYFDIHPVNFANSPTVNSSADASKPYVVARNIAVEKPGKVTPVVTYNGRKLVKGKDYDVDKTEATDSTTIKITAITSSNGIRNYIGSKDIEYKVVEKAKLAKNFKIDKIPDQQRRGYNNYDAKNPIPVTLEGILDTTVNVNADKKLTYNTDYYVVYENNVEVGTATAIFVGINDYAGTKEVKFRIVAPNFTQLVREDSLKISYNNQDITSTNKLTEPYQYEGKAIRLKNLCLKNGETTLELDKDYTVTYKNNNRAGNASVVLKGIGNYSGSITKSFKITPLDLTTMKAEDIGGTYAMDLEKKPVKYEKGGSKPTVELSVYGNRMQLGKDFTVSYRKNAKANETGEIIITGKGGLKGKLEKPFKIEQKKPSDADITVMIEDVAVSQSGKDVALSPKIVIKDANGKALSAGADYDKTTIQYKVADADSEKGSVTQDGSKWKVQIKDDSSVIKVTATIKAKDSDNCNYADEVKADFYVGYAKNSVRRAKVTVNYNNGTYKYFDYTGGQIKLNQNGSDKDLTVMLDGKTLVYNKDYVIMTAPDYIETYTNNIKKGTASVTIRGIGEYTGTQVVKYKIGAKQFNWDSIVALMNAIKQ